MENENKKINPDFAPVDETISKDDFVLVDSSKATREQKFQTRPTTFLKDSIKRFSKNKSSVVAAGILGFLLLMSAIVPAFGSSRNNGTHPYIYLEPKLFDAGTGFWDGTKKYDKVAVDTSANPEASTEAEKQQYWWPNAKYFDKNAISNKKFSNLTYASSLSDYTKGGYVSFGYFNNLSSDIEYVDYYAPSFTETFDVNDNHYVTVFDTYDQAKLNEIETISDDVDIPDNYVLGQAALYFLYDDGSENGAEIELIDYASVHNIGSACATKDPRVNISDVIKTKTSQTQFNNAHFAVRIKNEKNHRNTCVLIKSLVFETETTNATLASQITATSIESASVTLNQSKTVDKKTNYKYWETTGVVKPYLAQVIYCSFVYDTYEAAFGNKTVSGLDNGKFSEWKNKGFIDYIIDLEEDSSGHWYINEDTFDFRILNAKKCPLVREIEVSDIHVHSNATGKDSDWDCEAEVYMYKNYGFDSMPKFLMGTDKSGHDMFVLVFQGLLTSLSLGIITFAVCFTFGLIWGSVCGYFGGTVDLVMERLTDILSGVPWIVVMTLVIMNVGQNFFAFALALCMTGWIGTAATTRTQFYRFRGREYVLASRTLGATDVRLIFKHILPNAMGTIITGAVLMIPSVIFSEATISYLGLGLKNLASLGVILSDNQGELLSSPYLLIFPSVIIALLMISFNLFGNGLRDAVNPSLKGEGE